MQVLNLPTYSFKIKTKEQNNYIFDKIRKKYILLTPEEWVRQNFVEYLILEKKFPKALISLEYSLKLNHLAKRSDIVVFNRQGFPETIVECKAADVKIEQKVFDQIVRYNMTLKANYLIVTNGINHYCCKINYENNSYTYLPEIPEYEG